MSTPKEPPGKGASPPAPVLLSWLPEMFFQTHHFFSISFPVIHLNLYLAHSNGYHSRNNLTSYLLLRYNRSSSSAPMPLQLFRLPGPSALPLSSLPLSPFHDTFSSILLSPLVTRHLPKLDTPDTTRHARAAATPVLSISSTRFPSHMGVGLCAHFKIQSED